MGQPKSRGANLTPPPPSITKQRPGWGGLGGTALSSLGRDCPRPGLRYDLSDGPIPSVSYLHEDYNVECSTAVHAQMRVTSIIFLGLYGMAIPLAFPLVGLVQRWRGGEQREMETLAFLFVGFRKEYRYWESVNMLCKLLMTAIMTFERNLRVKVCHWACHRGFEGACAESVTLKAGAPEHQGRRVGVCVASCRCSCTSDPLSVARSVSPDLQWQVLRLTCERLGLHLGQPPNRHALPLPPSDPFCAGAADAFTQIGLRVRGLPLPGFPLC